MTAFALALCYAGLSAIALAMDRHHRQFRRRPPSLGLTASLRLLGWTQITGGLLACCLDRGWEGGPVLWLGLLTAAAALLVLLLSYAPRAVALGAIIGPATGLLAAVL